MSRSRQIVLLLFAVLATSPSAGADPDEAIADSPRWERRSVDVSPGARSAPCLVFDESSDSILMVGGLTDSDAALRDTWQWNGTRWRLLDDGTDGGPPGCIGDNAVFHDERETVVMASTLWSGGFEVESGLFEWTGKVWEQLPEQNEPISRLTPGLAYDESQSRLVLFGGGVSFAGTELPDDRDCFAFIESLKIGVSKETWLWNDGEWAFMDPKCNTPSAPRQVTTFYFDARRNAVVMMGGIILNTAIPDAWLLVPEEGRWERLHAGWDDWRLPHDGYADAYDSRRGRLLVTQGQRADEDGLAVKGDEGHVSAVLSYTDLWVELDVEGPTPPRLDAPSMVYDPGRDVMVMVGTPADDELADVQTWVLDLSPYSEPSGGGCGCGG